MDIGVADEALITDSVDRHYGFPRLVRVQNGDLLLFYRVGITHAYDDSAIAMRRSCDNGASWSCEQILRQGEAGFSAHNPVGIVSSHGKVILWASRFQYGPNRRLPNWWSTSNDHGYTWSPWTIFDSSQQHNCYYVTDVIHTSNGLLAGDATFPYSGQGTCHTRILFSGDDGRTWSCRSELTSPAGNMGDEVALMETEENTILCILRDRERADTFRLWSRDGGFTWSDRESIRAMLDCVLQRPFLTRLDENSYLLSGRDYVQKQVVAYLSVDRGQTFNHRIELDSFQKDGGYTTTLALDFGDCLIAWYSDSHTQPLMPDIKMIKVRL